LTLLNPFLKFTEMPVTPYLACAQGLLRNSESQSRSTSEMTRATVEIEALSIETNITDRIFLPNSTE
jgi:hypothetical protein